MNDKPRIIFGLAVFIVLATFPIWYTLGLAAYGAGDTAAPDREYYPDDAPRCIEKKQWMAANHMKLLYGWRDEVIRQGDARLYESQDGKEYVKSLTQTCLECHSKPEMCRDGNTSCTQCHDYANVEPCCWTCHVELKGSL